MEDVAEAIRGKRAKVVVIGLGYVGLPVACTFAEAGLQVWGIEQDQAKAAQIASGICPIGGDEPGLPQLLSKVIKEGRLHISSDYTHCRETDVALIAVETPVDTTSKKPAYRAIGSALRSLGASLQRGTLVIIESTIAPQTMENLVKPTLEETSGLRADTDFYLAYCPERIMPGKLLANLRSCNRVIGGTTRRAAEMARQLYAHIVEADLDVTDALTAELVKTTENAYRDVQIAFANEIALLCENVGSDVYEVRRLVNKSPFRDMHVPGAGVGGHCTPKDPWLLVHGTEGRLQARLIPTARAINDGMPLHIAELTEEALAEAGKSLEQARVTVLGYGYLENAADDRNSPTVPLVERLRACGATVTIHDPHFPEYRVDLREAITGSDVVIVMVAHDEYREVDLEDIREWVATPVLIDGRNVFDKKKARDLGFTYVGVGNR